MSVIAANPWPALPYKAWQDTCTTLHLWTQIVGKVRLACTPWLNHSWHVPLYVTPRGLTTSLVPYDTRAFAIDFDFVARELRIVVADGESRSIALEPQAVADFYAAVMRALDELRMPVEIVEVPSEIADGVRFSADHVHHTFDAESARRFWQVLVQAARVFGAFRTAFLGKCSPVHFFWGSFDLAVTRFSGRRAPLHPGAVPHLPRTVLREAYSHEVCSAGFWPGGGGFEDAAFYAYAYPEPRGFRAASVSPREAFYHPGLGEYLLPYEAVRTANDPDAALSAFLQSTYAAAADLGGWDRGALDCAPGRPRVPRRAE